MNRQQMIKLLEAGEKPIDVAIQKWEQILEGTGNDKGGGNCALCYTYGKACSHSKNNYTCPCNKYNPIKGCETYYQDTPYYTGKQLMLSFLYLVKDLMIEDGRY